MNSCKICQAPTKNKCTNCCQVFYCSVDHQKQDWKLHKQDCHPFKIEENEELGRYLVATRSIQPFEIILRDSPLIRGPSQITSPVCLGCLNVIDENDHTNCDKCGWPLCSDRCGKAVEHQEECILTQKRNRKVNIQEFTHPHPMYQCLSTVRGLCLKDTNAVKWDKLRQLASMENNRKGSLQWKVDLESIGKFIPKFFNTQKFNEDDIMKMIGILQINGHEVPTTDPPHVTVYYYASFLEHSCTPNLAKSFTKCGDVLLYAPNGVKKNSHLSICYTDAVWGTADRQRHLMQTKLFKCACFRCIDVTEFSSNYSGLVCIEKVCNGTLLPTDFRSRISKWKCSDCETSVETSEIDKILERASTDMQNMEKNETNCVRFINHYQKWLTATHYYICEVKIQLVQLIGKDPKELMIVDTEKLQMKIKYAHELIELYKKLAPCEVRLLGMLCFELHAASAEQARRISLASNISSKDMLQESLTFVDKCVSYLQYESDIFIEGNILKQAKINRDALKMVLKL